LPEPKAFGNGLTADHSIPGNEEASKDDDEVLCAIQDGFTAWLEAYQAATNDTEHATLSFKTFLGPEVQAKHVYTDSAPESEKALLGFGILVDTSTPYRSETNGIGEHAARKVKEGTPFSLHQSGWNEEWWALQVLCYCLLRNMADVLRGGRSPWFKRFESDLPGPVIYVGLFVEYKPYSPDAKARLHELGESVCP